MATEKELIIEKDEELESQNDFGEILDLKPEDTEETIATGDEGAEVAVPDEKKRVKNAAKGKGKTAALANETATEDKESADENLPDVMNNGKADRVSRSEIVEQSRIAALERKNRAEKRERAEQNNALRVSEWEQLVAARKENRILSGVLVSIQNIARGSEVLGVAAIVSCGNFNITIPFSEVFRDTTVTGPNQGIIRRRQRNLLMRSMGAPMSFCITDMTGNPNGEYIIAGSRKAALERIGIYNLHKGQGGRSLYEVGDVVNAKIIAVGRGALFINVLGFDISLKNWSVTYKYIENFAEEYRVGDDIAVRIMRIDYDDDGMPINITVSGRHAEKDEYVERVKNLYVGSIWCGHITNIYSNKNGTPTIAIYLEDAKVPGYAVFGYLRNGGTALVGVSRPPMVGDSVSVEIFDIMAESGLIRGRILRINN
ncbi:MAG: S1 RNA-binding domain-containing protein [Clostridiales bacterium]|nr:S1 RNA-binding domain-containing protein [Clostridiales bacterium]